MSRTELVSTNPVTGQAIWSGPVAGPDDVDRAVEAARAAFPAWARRDLSDRIAILRSFQDVVRSRAEDFARLIATETGKPLWESRSEVDSVFAKVDISIIAHEERSGVRSTDLGQVHQRVRHKPHGVLAVLGPYNFPAHLPNGHVVPALLAGNSVVLKPSERTPAVGEYMLDCWNEAGLPDAVLNLVQGGADTGQMLASHPGMDGLLFTGSSAAGLALHRLFAHTPQKILALEMGGNNPLLLWDVADLDAAATLILQSAYISAGQRCTCARRLIVEDSNSEEIIGRLTSLIDRVIVGAPFDEPQPFMGPVIDNRAADRLETAFAQLVGNGAAVLRMMDRPDEEKPFLTPALLDVTDLRDRNDEEHFGPLLQLIRVPDWESAIAEANRTRFGLCAGLIGGDEQLYRSFWNECRAGLINWNRPTTGAASAAPFGGIGLSGNHRPSAYYAADYCSIPVASIESEQPHSVPIVGLQS